MVYYMELSQGQIIDTSSQCHACTFKVSYFLNRRGRNNLPDTNLKRQHVMIFSYFSQKIGLDIFYILSSKEILQGNIRKSFLGKIRKHQFAIW